MFNSEVSNFVGSATAQLANDMKSLQKQTRCLFVNKQSSCLNSCLSCVSPRQSADCEAIAANDKLANRADLDSSGDNVILGKHLDGLDFDLIRISCKKELDDEQELQKSPRKKMKKSTVLKWAGGFAVLLIFGVLLGISIYFIVTRVLASRIFGSSISKRSTENIIDSWTGERIPAIYEIDPLTFCDTFDGHRDKCLSRIASRLDYIQNTLKMNTVLIRNVQSSAESSNNGSASLEGLDARLGNSSDLKLFLSTAQKRGIKVIVELDLTRTSIRHEWFKSNLTQYYLTKNASSENVSASWTYDSDRGVYYLNNGESDRAYLNFESAQTREKVLDVMRYWCSEFKMDAVYLKNLDKMAISNNRQNRIFVEDLRLACQQPTRWRFVMIGDFVPEANRPIVDLLVDIYRVDLNATSICRSSTSSNSSIPASEPFSQYLSSTKKKLIWSVENIPEILNESRTRDDELRQHLFKQLYTIVYSVPGIVLLKQGDELQMLAKEEQTKLKELGYVSRRAEWISKFIVLLNSKVKPKLFDRIEELELRFPTPSPYTTANPRPERFRNSNKQDFKSFYMTNQIYQIAFDSRRVLKVTREINHYDAYRRDSTRSWARSFFSPAAYSLKFFRNVVVLVNFSPHDYYVENLLKSDDDLLTNTNVPVHIVHDSSNTMPEELHLNSANFDDSTFKLKSNHYLVLEI